jgi:hypothetical protein
VNILRSAHRSPEDDPSVGKADKEAKCAAHIEFRKFIHDQIQLFLVVSLRELDLHCEVGQR